MPERQTGNQVTQFGLETVAGTAVAANKKFKSFDVTINPTGEMSSYRPQGSRLPTVVVPGQEWTGGAISGAPVYDELMYLLAMTLGAPTTTVTGVTGQQHVFTFNAEGAQNAKTFTIEKGDSVRAGKASHVLATDLAINLTRNEFTIDGSVIGQLYTDGVTMTASPTTFPQIPILPKQFSLFLDDTSAALGTTKYLRGFAASLSLSGLVSAIWPINDALTSFATTVDTSELDATMELRVEADASGMALLTSLRAGSTKFLRIVSQGPVIGAGPATYALQIDAAVKIANYADFDDEDGLYVVPWPLQIVNDAWGSLKITLTNATAAL